MSGNVVGEAARIDEAEHKHFWSAPQRANNRFGRRSTSLYETTCAFCHKREVRNGLARLKREVIDS